MRLAPVALVILGCGGSPPPESPPPREASEGERCQRALADLGARLDRTIDQRLTAATSSEEASFALLALTPKTPGGQALVQAALAEQKLSRDHFGRCLAHEPEARGRFERRVRDAAARARARAAALPLLSDTSEGCERLLPLMVSAKENLEFPLALGARMILPCAGKVSERELRCAIAEGKLAYFSACQRGEREPPAPR
jgi:hypothetical protein